MPLPKSSPRRWRRGQPEFTSGSSAQRLRSPGTPPGRLWGNGFWAIVGLDGSKTSTSPSVGLTKVDLTGKIFATVFDLFAEAYRKALEDSSVRTFDAVQIGIMDSEEFENRANIATKIADRLGTDRYPRGPIRNRVVDRRRRVPRSLSTRLRPASSRHGPGASPVSA